MSEKPETPEQHKLIPAKLNDPKVLGGKIGHVVTPGDIDGVCAGTGVKVTYQEDRLYPVTAVAVDFDAARKAGWFNQQPAPKPRLGEPEEVPDPLAEKMIDELPDMAKVAKVAKVAKMIIDAAAASAEPKPVKPKTCPKCGGKRRGRGYTHTESCTR